MSFSKRRNVKGQSDPWKLDCKCGYSGLVLLFYKYCKIENPLQEAQELLLIASNLTGKVRVANEGINITVAGSTVHTQAFIDEIMQKPYLRSLKLADQVAKTRFFKPSPGCIHGKIEFSPHIHSTHIQVFNDLSIKVVDEICPLNVANWNPKTMRTTPSDNIISALEPADFHNALLNTSEDTMILDVRNHYEAKLGHFDNAVQLPIRNFKSLPHYLSANKNMFEGKKKIFTYCTGGIRCEKASAWIQENINLPVTMLEGGIHEYLEWIKQSNEQSLFLGRNYVFDARVSLGLDDGQVVGACVYCKSKCQELMKCIGENCHLMFICCDACASKLATENVTTVNSRLVVVDTRCRIVDLLML